MKKEWGVQVSYVELNGMVTIPEETQLSENRNVTGIQRTGGRVVYRTGYSP